MSESLHFVALHQMIANLTNLPPEEWTFLRSHLILQIFEEGVSLQRQGDTNNLIFFVCHGLLKTSFIEPCGELITKGFVVEGGLCAPYASILTRKPSSVAITAFETSVVIAMESELLEVLYTRHPCWQEVGRKIGERLLAERERREYQMLALSAEQRYAQFCKNYDALCRRIPQYEIASYLGITPVSLSQIRRKISTKILNSNKAESERL